jgi:N-acetyl-anhydromuramyl-L-alanine amidase AmpD
METYAIEDIVGHEDVARPVGRKVDPGPKFPWDKINSRYWEC